MSMQPVGVQFTAAGADQFVAAMNQAQGAADQFTRSLESQRSSSQGLTLGTIALGSMLGDLASNAIQAVTSGLMNFGNAAVQNAAALQDLEITLTSLIASEAVQAGAADTVQTAMGIVGDRVDEVFAKIKKISLESPFQYQQIVQVMQMNMAFGQTSDKALELTQAITNLAAVNKGIPGVLQRITYNFSQMNMVGKIMARDVRDLAMAGVDLKKVLKQELGMTIDEVNEKLKTGQLTFEQVSTAFATWVNKNFGDAAKRAAYTLGGLVSSFKDLFFFTSSDLFKPALDAITQSLGRMLDVAIQFVDTGALKGIGYALEAIAQKALAPIQALMTATTTVKTWGEHTQMAGEQAESTMVQSLTNITHTLEQKAYDAFVWGMNIMAQLAGGIAEGAATALVSAMEFVGSMLTFWLAPGSPPKVAPEIDMWGTLAMTEFLQGFTEADFGILDTMQGPIKNALSSLVTGGAMKQNQSQDIFKNISEALITGISGGDIGGALDQIKNSTGAYGNLLADLVKKQWELSVATEKATNAQKALNAAQEKEKEARQTVSDLVEEYNQMIQTGANPDALKAQRDRIIAAQASVVSAQKEGKEAAKTLDAAGKEVAPLQEKVNLQQKLLEQIIELNNAKAAAAKEDAGAAEKKGAGGGKDAAAAAADAIKNMAGSFGKTNIDGDALKKKIKEAIDKAFEPVGKVYEEKIKPAFDRIDKAWKEFAPTLERFWKEILKPALEWVIQNKDTLFKIAATIFIAQKASGALFDIVTTVLKVLGMFGIASTLTLPLMALIAAIGLLIAVIIVFGKQAYDNFIGIANLVGIILSTLWQRSVQFWTAFVKFIITKLVEVLVNVVQWGINFINNINSFIATVKTYWNSFWTSVLDQAIVFIAQIIDKILSFKERVVTKFQELKTAVINFVTMIKTEGTTLFENFVSGALKKAEELKTGVVDFVKAIPDEITKLLQVFVDLGKSIIGWIISGLQAAGAGLSSYISGLIAGVLANFGLSFQGGGNGGGSSPSPSSPTATGSKTGGHGADKMASGGDIKPGKEYLVGDAGPEILKLGKAGHIFPNRMVRPPAAPKEMATQAMNSISTVNNFNLGVTTMNAPDTITRSFQLMQVLAANT